MPETFIRITMSIGEAERIAGVLSDACHDDDAEMFTDAIEDGPFIAAADVSRPALPLDESKPCPRGDALATAVHRIVCEGEEGGWVSGLPPDAAQRLEAAVNAYCVDDPPDAVRERTGRDA